MIGLLRIRMTYWIYLWIFRKNSA